MRSREKVLPKFANLISAIIQLFNRSQQKQTLPETENMLKEFLTLPEFAELYRIGQHKAAYLIAAGELEAVNVATNKSGRPRWRISLEAIERFKRNRSAIEPQPVSTPKRRKRRPFGRAVRQYF